MLCVKEMDKNYAFNKPGTAEKIIGRQSENTDGIGWARTADGWCGRPVSHSVMALFRTPLCGWYLALDGMPGMCPPILAGSREYLV